MSVQELVTKYTFDIDTKPLENVENKVQGLVTFMAKLGAAGAAAAGTVFAWTKLTAQAGDEALATSQKLGLSVEKLTAMQYAAKLSNVETGTFNTGLRFLSKNMDDASKGTGDAGQAFKKLGVQFKDGNGGLLATDQVLIQLADKFQKMPNGAAKTATAMNLFGKAGADLIPLLNEGSDGIQKMMTRADELGVTMSTELAQAGDDFNDSMDELLGGLTGLRNMVGSQLIPLLTPIVKAITNWVVANRKLIATKLEVFMKMLMTFAGGVLRIFESVGRVTLGLSRLFGGLENMAKALGVAFMIFAGAKVLYMIGTLTVAIGGLVSMITAANIAALAVPLAIGAAIAILALLIEDIYTFFTDPEAETFFGDLVEGIKSVGGKIIDWFVGLLQGWGAALKNWAVEFGSWILSFFKPITDLLSKVGGVGQKIAKGDFSAVKDLAGSAISGIGNALGFSPSSSPATTQSAVDNSMQNKMSVVNNINLGAGADPTQVGKSVMAGTKDGIDGALRGAQRSFSKKGGY